MAKKNILKGTLDNTRDFLKAEKKPLLEMAGGAALMAGGIYFMNQDNGCCDCNCDAAETVSEAFEAAQA